MRANVIARLCRGFRDARNAIVLTHNIDFLFVQSVLVPALRRVGNPNLTIFADAACAASAYRQQRALLEGLGARYRVVMVDLGTGRRFHAKALLLADRERSVCAVGSGNLTHGGMGANHEVWTVGTSDGEGAVMLAALRDFVHSTVDRTPLADPVRDGVHAFFDAEQTWVAGLPPAAGLVMSPSDTPLLDQISALAGAEVRSVTVLTPYFDPDGAALREIQHRFGVPVTAWLQPRHAGLSRTAQQALPADVRLQTVDCKEDRAPSFIHAKVLAFHRDDDVVVAVGSANCSRAALLADAGWGNAELMAVDVVAPAAFEDLFGELARSDATPSLPDDPPSDDWEVETAPLRVLAARQAAGRLDVAFASAMPLVSLSLKSEEGDWPARDLAADEQTASFSVSLPLRAIRLLGSTASGGRLESDWAWVDDEARLATPASFRGLETALEVLDDVESTDHDPLESFTAVLDKFAAYLRDPEAGRRRSPSRAPPGLPPPPYDPAEVFSGSFGRAIGTTSTDSDIDRSRTSLLAVVESLFSVGASGGVTGGNITSRADGEDPDAEVEQERLTKRPEPRARTQVLRALDAVSAALIDREFVSTRKPRMLGEDIALAAILLVKARVEGWIDPETGRAATRKLWSGLFFDRGLIAERLQLLGSEAHATMVADLASPKLSAALLLWCLPEWRADDLQAIWFQASAALLHLRHPWLFASAPPPEVVVELSDLAARLLPPDEADAVGETWTRLVRSGEALRLLYETLGAMPHREIVKAATSAEVRERDLLWQANALAFPARAYQRDATTRAEVMLIGESHCRRFRGDHLVPVRDLISSDAVGLPAAAREEIAHFVEQASEAHLRRAELL